MSPVEQETQATSTSPVEHETQATSSSPVQQETVSNNTQSDHHMTAEQPAATAPIENHESTYEDKENTMQENRER